MPLTIHSTGLEELARRQLERDRKRTAAFPGLFEQKLARMKASPLAYLRGSAPLFYDILQAHPDIRKGPRGRGWISGDLHVENFGAYRPHTHAADDDGAQRRTHDELATFNLNDFDDAIHGPWYFDVLRLSTSLALGVREAGADGPRTIALVASLLNSYVEHAWGHRAMPPAPAPVDELIGRVLVRTRKQLLDARTEVVRGKRRFVRGTRYRPIARELAAEARRAFERYTHKLGEETVDPSHMQVQDLAFRVAGTGSLGGLRVAVLASGKGGVDGGWIFDMKEQGMPSPAIVLGPPKQKPAKRVVAANLACLEHPPRMMSTTKLGNRSMFVRRLSPQEDKLVLTSMRSADLEPLARYLGALTGAAHRRAAEDAPTKMWSVEARETVLDRALLLAAVHEGLYLAMCRATR